MVFTDFQENRLYALESFSSGIPVPAEFPIGRSVSAMTWDEFQEKRQQYYQLSTMLFKIWRSAEVGPRVQEMKTALERLLDEIVDKPLLLAFHLLNLSFFKWLSKVDSRVVFAGLLSHPQLPIAFSSSSLVILQQQRVSESGRSPR